MAKLAHNRISFLIEVLLFREPPMITMQKSTCYKIIQKLNRYWVVQYNREPLCKTYDYLASLTIIVEEEVTCLYRNYPGLGDMAHQREIINVKTRLGLDRKFHNTAQELPRLRFE